MEFIGAFTTLKLSFKYWFSLFSPDSLILFDKFSSNIISILDYLKTRKVVQLDDLGAHFNLKIHEVVERLEQLQEDGTINGVIDDRGKFIYISEEEMKSVVK